MRPRGVRYKKLNLGLDLPSWFFYRLKGIDHDFQLVFHPYQVLWDNIINEYEGELDDTRFTIHREHGELVFGYVLTNGEGEPTPDNTWHLWRFCNPHGWAHIVKIENKHERYLELLLNRLYLQAKISDRYGHRAWTRKLEDDKSDEADSMAQDKKELFQAVQEENSWLTKRAMDNMGRGMVNATRPQKDIIFSAGGVSKRSKITRDIRDREGGLVFPDEM